MSKIKAKAVAVPVAQSQQQAEEMIAKIGDMRRELLRIEADHGDEMARLKEQHDEDRKALGARINDLVSGVQTWAEANRERLTHGGKVKFFQTASGLVKWRARPPKVTIRGKEAVVEALEAAGLGRFIRLKQEPNKEAILNEPEAVGGIKGISIGREGEDFVIEPHGLELSRTEEPTAQVA